MLPEEFRERTNVKLTSEEYAEVEHLYNSVQMHKDQFCKLWLELRDNQMVKELMVTIKNLETSIRITGDELNSKIIELDEKEAQYKLSQEQASTQYRNEIERIGKKIIAAGTEAISLGIYDVIEEEFGIDFIIRSKWQMGIKLSESEIDYMVKKL